MKKIIKLVDEKRGIAQITTADERWYVRQAINVVSGVPETKFVPSVTWISSFFPKNIFFYKWLASTGWDEAQAIKSAAGDKGTKVHHAVTDLLAGKEIAMNANYLNPTTGQGEELTLDEYECLMSFAEWFKLTKPEIIANELVVWNDEVGYAGTVDLVVKIGDQNWIIDLKTGQNLWTEHELQISAYKHALKLEQEPKLALLQVGYKRNKHSWKFTEVEDKFGLFLAAREIWRNETDGEQPRQKDYPLTLSLVGKEEKQKQIKCKTQKNFSRKPISSPSFA